MEDLFSRTILKHKLDSKEVLLACSGGLDSMCLAHLMIKHRLKFALAHVNFQLRGAESDGDEEFVKNFALQHGISFFTKKADTMNYAEQNGISTQMAARELRYRFFYELLNQHGFQHLLTAHHMNDDIETVLINFGRGSSLRALSGIKEEQGNILRPLLRVTRHQLTDWAKLHNIQWREDSSNAGDHYLRNELRHKVVPLLEAAFPNFYKSVSKSLDQLKQDEQGLQVLLQEKLNAHLVIKEQEQRLVLTEISDSLYLKPLLRLWLSAFGAWDMDAVFNLIYAGSGARVANTDWKLLRDRNCIILTKAEPLQSVEILIHLHDNAIEEPLSLTFTKMPVEDWLLNTDQSIAQLDFEKLTFPLKLRLWRQGDKFKPLGMKGFKKLSDFLIDEKTDVNRKNRTYVLCSGPEIVWVAGHRIDERFKVSYSTKTVYFVQLNQT